MVILVLICLGHAVSAGNCSTVLQEPLILKSPNGATVLSSFGAYGYLQAAHLGVVYPTSFTIHINFTGIGERNKTYAARQCSTPTGLASSPFDTSESSGPLAPLLNYYHISDFDCYLYRTHKVIQGVTIEGLESLFTTPAFPGARASIAYEFSDKDLEIIPTYDTTYTNGNIYTYKWTYVNFLF